MRLVRSVYVDAIKIAVVAIAVLNQICEATARWRNFTRHEKRLFEDLFNDYNKEMRPVLRQSDVVNVYFEIALSEILDLDEINQVLVTNVWLRQKWTDEWLKWNYSTYSGIKSINIDPTNVWKPDILLYNNIHTYDNVDNGEQYLSKTKVIIENDGTVSWLSPNKLSTSCKINIKYFPFDVQECQIIFRPWTYSGDKLALHFLNNQKVDLSIYSKNGEFDLLSAKGKLKKVIDPCCSYAFDDITYTLVMKRRPLFYLNNLIIPCIVLALLTGISFLFPPETGERITLVVTVLLGMTVFMIVCADFIPSSSDVTPLIGKYFVIVLFEVAACLLATCVPLRLHHLHPGTAMPHWAKVAIFDYLAVAMCFRCRYNRKKVEQLTNNDHNDNKHDDNNHDAIENNHTPHDDLDLIELKQGTLDGSGAKNLGKMTDPEGENSQFDGIASVTKYVDKLEREGELYAEWKEAIAVLDRFFFLVFIVTFTVSSIMICPSLTDHS